MALKLERKLRVNVRDSWDMGTGHFAQFRSPPKRGQQISPRRFYHCRDRFQERFRHRHILFQHRAGERMGIVRFFNQLEKKLGIAKRDRSKFGPTQVSYITWVRVSPFWMGEFMRRSLFTAMLRAARQYKKKSTFMRAVFSVPYTRSTRDAVKRFLKGYTSYNGMSGCSGWQHAFGQRHGEYTYDQWTGQPRWQERPIDLNVWLVKPRTKRGKK